jgi:2,4-dienoyl-CoA reductase-like NADH-dependent reductase (Old Yellow Enzyme family)
MPTSSLFEPFLLKSLTIKNRVVMAPMTRAFSPNGIPGEDVAGYYGRRAAGEVGLILSEGTVIDRLGSANNPSYPHFYGEDALAGWQEVIKQVHDNGGKMGPQIWHVGIQPPTEDSPVKSEEFEGPSGINLKREPAGHAMTDSDIADAIAQYAHSASEAKRLGFDMVEIHGAHGYLIDQFFWDVTNRRADEYGGEMISDRVKFGVDVVKAVRDAVGEDFVISLRLSQWKPFAYDAKIGHDPKELEAWLAPLSQAGVDIFHCSQRRFWEPEFEGSDLNFAGWAKKLTGKATITVGSVGLDSEFTSAFRGDGATPTPLDELYRRFDRGDFDLVAVGRVLLSDPNWVQKLRTGRESEFLGFDKSALATLV